MSGSIVCIEPIWHLLEDELRYSKPANPSLMTYASDLTDAEWEIFEPLLLEILPTKKQTRPSNWTKPELFDGILYQLKNGCNWQDLPKDLPPYSTVYWHYKQWRAAGVFQELMRLLHGQVREQVKKKPQWTTLRSIDSQAVKNTCNASVESKGFCFYSRHQWH